MNILDSIVDGALALPDGRDSDALIGAVVRYLRTGEEPSDLPQTAAAMWTAIFPVVENSRKRSQSGRRGGSSRRDAGACGEDRRGEGDGGSMAEGEEPSKPESKQPSKRGSKTASKQPSKTRSKRASEQVSSLLIPNSNSSSQFPFGMDGECGDVPEPPSLEEVRSYFGANCLKGDPAEFFDHFSAQGWVRSNGQDVSDWMAQARLWARRQVEFDQSKPPELRQPVSRLPVSENRRDYAAELAAFDAGKSGAAL